MMAWRQYCHFALRASARALRAACAGLAIVVASCSGGEGPPDVVLTSIDLTPASTTLQVGVTQQFAAAGHYSDGSTASVTATWSATGGTISTSGLYTAGAVAGDYQVVATEQGGSISKAAAVTLTAAPPVLTSISLSPSSISLAPAATQQFVATGHFTGGGTGSVTVTWTATGGTISTSGLYTAGAAVGPYQVTATVTGGSIAGTAAVTITPAPPTLTSVTVAPATITLVPAATQQFAATAHYSDGSTSRTLPMDWTAAGGTVNATGLYTAGAVDGNYQVTATAQGTAIAGQATVTIATPPPNLVSIEVSPPGVRILPFITQQYTAVGRLSDNSTTPVAVTWSVTFSTLTSVHNTISASGLFSAGNVLGPFTVTATQVGGSLSGSVPVSVHSTTGLTVAPASFAFWNPQPGKVYLCTSNHYTDDPAGLGGTAATTAAPADGVTAPNVVYSNQGPQIYPDGSGEVKVVCQVVWSAPPIPNDGATVTITVSESPGSGMAKVFNYTRLVCYSDPPTNSMERPCTRTDYTSLQEFDPARTAPVASTVTVSATTGANIWFKNTLVP